MPANYVLLERIELNASAASVTFNNIPQSGYTDLKIIVSARMSNYAQIAGVLNFAFNGGSVNASLTTREIVGTGSGVGSSTTEWPVVNGGTSTSNVYNNLEIYIPNYTSSNNKSFSVDSVIENNATTSYQRMNAFLWSNTAAISSIGLSGSGNFDQYSTFSLYALAAVGTTPVIAPKASGGNITTDGTYWYHTFLSTGTFTPATSLSCDYLVVAGGGGGGADASGNQGGGGGGAGAFLTGTASVTATSYTITVGAGGAGSTSGNGTQGGNSSFSSTTATGGGYGGYNTGNGGNGGSGGGAGGYSNSATGGTATTGGNAGGNNNSTGRAGGGGGAGAVGGNGGSGAGGAGSGGNGGSGVNTYSTWASATSTGVSGYYAGGGGGGGTGSIAATGGAGGGGSGALAVGTDSTAGTANTGGGGGGGNYHGSAPYNQSSAGGSGIVIVRYLVA